MRRRYEHASLLIGLLLEVIDPKTQSIVDRMKKDNRLDRLISLYKRDKRRGFEPLRRHIGSKYGWWINDDSLMDDLLDELAR